MPRARSTLSRNASSRCCASTSASGAGAGAIGRSWTRASSRRLRPPGARPTRPRAALTDSVRTWARSRRGGSRTASSLVDGITARRERYRRGCALAARRVRQAPEQPAGYVTQLIGARPADRVEQWSAARCIEAYAGQYHHGEEPGLQRRRKAPPGHSTARGSESPARSVRSGSSHPRSRSALTAQDWTPAS